MIETCTKIYEFFNDVAEHLIMLQDKFEECFLPYMCDFKLAEEPIHQLPLACTFTN